MMVRQRIGQQQRAAEQAAELAEAEEAARESGEDFQDLPAKP